MIFLAEHFSRIRKQFLEVTPSDERRFCEKEQEKFVQEVYLDEIYLFYDHLHIGSDLIKIESNISETIRKKQGWWSVISVGG